MFKVRVIPCLDVKDGRVVKGVNFVDLRRAKCTITATTTASAQAPNSASPAGSERYEYQIENPRL